MTVTSTARTWAVDEETATTVTALLRLAPQGLKVAYNAAAGEFAQTVRGLRGSDGVHVRREGHNARYDAMAALGLHRLDEATQREVLAGNTAADLAELISSRARAITDPGAIALAAWARAEICGVYDAALFRRLSRLLRTTPSLATVDVSWMVSAAAAAAPLGDTAEVMHHGADLLMAHCGNHGIFPHRLPAADQPRWRAHIGCFADQVYPIQALTRAGLTMGQPLWIDAASRTAQQICRLQGDHGQWWWHYDVRNGSVVEGYPVYSVHQHAMAPMALLELREAGGSDHTAEIQLGVRWLETHPEVVEELVSPRWGVVWRKVGRREPPKATRAVQAVATTARAGAKVPGVDRMFPAANVDHECRPYELGWLLYAWQPTAAVTPASRVNADE